MDPRICPLAFLNKTQMREMAKENNFSTPSSLRVDEYRGKLGNALSGDPQDYVPQDNFIYVVSNKRHNFCIISGATAEQH